MKVKVVIEYEIPVDGPLTVEDRLAMHAALEREIPTVFEHTDGAAFWAQSFTVEVQE